jgi:hypothetical protein
MGEFLMKARGRFPEGPACQWIRSDAIIGVFVGWGLEVVYNPSNRKRKRRREGYENLTISYRWSLISSRHEPTVPALNAASNRDSVKMIGACRHAHLGHST